MNVYIWAMLLLLHNKRVKSRPGLKRTKRRDEKMDLFGKKRILTLEEELREKTRALEQKARELELTTELSARERVIDREEYAKVAREYGTYKSAVEQKEAERKHRESIASGICPEKLEILVVEDTPKHLMLLDELREKGHQVTVVSSYSAATRYLKEKRPHVLLLDRYFSAAGSIAGRMSIEEERGVGYFGGTIYTPSLKSKIGQLSVETVLPYLKAMDWKVFGMAQDDFMSLFGEDLESKAEVKFKDTIAYQKLFDYVVAVSPRLQGPDYSSTTRPEQVLPSRWVTGEDIREYPRRCAGQFGKFIDAVAKCEIKEPLGDALLTLGLAYGIPYIGMLSDESRHVGIMAGVYTDLRHHFSEEISGRNDYVVKIGPSKVLLGMDIIRQIKTDESGDDESKVKDWPKLVEELTKE